MEKQPTTDKGLKIFGTSTKKLVLASEIQIGGEHYLGKNIQPLDVIDEYQLDFYLGNVLKYILRKKGDKYDRIQDLKKAKHYIELYLERVMPNERISDIPHEQ